MGRMIAMLGAATLRRGIRGRIDLRGPVLAMLLLTPFVLLVTTAWLIERQESLARDAALIAGPLFAAPPAAFQPARLRPIYASAPRLRSLPTSPLLLPRELPPMPRLRDAGSRPPLAGPWPERQAFASESGWVRLTAPFSNPSPGPTAEALLTGARGALPAAFFDGPSGGAGSLALARPDERGALLMDPPDPLPAPPDVSPQEEPSDRFVVADVLEITAEGALLAGESFLGESLAEAAPFQYTAIATPEPSAGLLFFAGLVALGARRRR